MRDIRVLLSRIFGRERRHESKPVDVERRQSWPRKPSAKDAHERVLRAYDELENTMRLTRADFKDPSSHREASNDRQQVVIFRTLQEVCRFRGSDGLKVRLCRNPAHQDAANTELAICNEDKCPIILAALHTEAA